MQKSLTQTNLQLANVISDVMGVTGQKFLRAILAGERDAEKLLPHPIGAPQAITAMAHKVAVLFYRRLRFGQKYLYRGQQFYPDKYLQQLIAFLERQAAQLGLAVTPASTRRFPRDQRRTHIQ